MYSFVFHSYFKASLAFSSFPSGLVHSNTYYSSGTAKGFLQQQADLGIRTNSFGYLNGNVAGHTNELGLVVSNTWDKLNRLVQTAYPDSTTVSNWFDKLDVRGEKDRLNQWSFYGYDAKRRRVAITNAASQVTLLSYCGCGSPSTITQYKGSTPIYTYHNYDQRGRLTNTIYADGYQLNRIYAQDGDLLNVTDNAGRTLVLDYTQLGPRRGLSLARLQSLQLGQFHKILEQAFDEYGRTTNSIDRNYVETHLGYDYLGRLTRRQAVGYLGTAAGQESFYYNSRGLTNHVDPSGFSTKFVRDTAGRILYQTNANLEVLEFSYNPADQLTLLKDGKGQTTRWNYNAYGLVTNKVDAASYEIFRYGYDAGERLTSRWTVGKGNTYFGYDTVGNLTNIAYPTYTNRLSYDNLNRLTGMVDRAGSTAFTWTDGNQLATEDGPWDVDTVGYAYSGRQRQTLSVVQPNDSPWVQSYGYNDLARLESVISPAGTFSYTHWWFDWVQDVTFPGSAHVSSTPDDLGRVTENWLFSATIETTGYSYNSSSQRTQQVFSAGNYLNFTYDNIGQLKTAKGYESGGAPRLQEQFGYAYDAAWNLARRTNNALTQTLNVDSRNQLTTGSRIGTLTVAGTVGQPNSTASVTVSGTGLGSGAATVYGDGTWARAGATLADGANTYTATATDGYGRTSQDSVSFTLPAAPSFTYDGNGNLTSDGLRTFEYDFENQLTNVYVTAKWRSEFVYDTLMRRRARKEYTWLGSAWVQTNEVRYVYDQQLVLQERWFNPQISLVTPQRLITYTRGKDLSGELQEAGGIGGLLARSDSALMQSDPAAAHVFYVADPGGNITALVNSKLVVVARYQYDPFGNLLSMSGPIAEANLYRFSSKEYHPNSGLVYYLYRYYEPNLQRWVNRDPIGEMGGINLYAYVDNNPVNYTDPFGLDTCSCDRKIGGGPAKPRGLFWNTMPRYSHTFIFTTNPDGTIKHTYSWGNTKNPRGWNLDQPEDIAAAKDALKKGYNWNEGGKALDPFVDQAFHELNKKENEHRNLGAAMNCKTETQKLLDKARLDQKCSCFE